MANNTVILRARDRWTKERDAGGPITPGQLIELNASGQVIRHATDGGIVAATTFALEDQVAGRGIDDDYASGESVVYQHFVPGEEVYALLNIGENVGIGQVLESVGNGNLGIPTALSEGQAVAIALEAVNAVATSRIRVQII